MYAHGGGWFLCSLELYDNPCRALANATGCMVLSVDYWLAPEHKFPVPVEDFYCALRWVCEQAGMLGVDPARIAVGGDSAGGNLAAAAAIMARDRGGPRIAHQLLCYPVLDHSFSTDSYRAYGQNFFLTEETMRYCWFTYLLNEQDGDSPYASPLRGGPDGPAAGDRAGMRVRPAARRGRGLCAPAARGRGRCVRPSPAGHGPCVHPHAGLDAGGAASVRTGGRRAARRLESEPQAA